MKNCQYELKGYSFPDNPLPIEIQNNTNISWGKIFMLKNQPIQPGTLRTVFSIGLIILCLFSFACASKVKNTIPATALEIKENTYPQAEYRIQPGDLLDIKFFHNPQLDEKVPVRPDGRISLQLVHEIMAAGRTPAELRDLLMNNYEKHLQKVNISIIIRSFSSLKVYVNGEVGQPKIVELKGVMTVLQAIADAGGFQDTALINEVIIIRQKPGSKPLAIQLDMEKVFQGTDTTQDIQLMPYDIVFVPRTTIANVDLWVDQYIRQVLPFSSSFSADYNINGRY